MTTSPPYDETARRMLASEATAHDQRTLGERFPRSPELRFVLEFARVAASLNGKKANLDFGLASVSRVLGLPRSSGLTLFAIGRAIGWIGHAIEQYAVDRIIRPRARYVGVAPS